MAKPKIVRMGSEVWGVEIKSDRNDPEKEGFRISFPFGVVETVRTTDNRYWVHVRVNRPDAGLHDPDDPQGTIADARLDITGRHTADVDIGEFDDPDLYHLAVLVGPKEG